MSQPLPVFQKVKFPSALRSNVGKLPNLDVDDGEFPVETFAKRSHTMETVIW